MAGGPQAATPCPAETFGAGPFPGTLYIVIFYAFSNTSTLRKLQAGCSAGGPGPQGCKVLHLHTGWPHHADCSHPLTSEPAT